MPPHQPSQAKNVVEWRRSARRRRRRRTNLIATCALALAALLGSTTLLAHGPLLPNVRAQEFDAILGQSADASDSAPAAAPTAAVPTTTAQDLQVDEFYVHIPAGAVEPLRVVVLLHGMGENGADFSGLARDRADAAGWMLVAPTFDYGNWMDPTVVTHEASTDLPRIAAFLDRLPSLTGVTVQPQIYLYGFSRGGQTANRFALDYPERVAKVAICSAGDYTVPVQALASQGSLDFPYGVGNLDAVFGHAFDRPDFIPIAFWIGVGASDSDPTDVPHQWDPTIGTNRVERAQRFAQWLSDAGMSVTVHLFDGVGHTETETMRDAAYDFLASSP